MRISNSWLKEYVEIPAPETLENVLEMAGIGVDEYDAETGVWALEVTSNRGDWLCAKGLAREIAAMTNQRFRAGDQGYGNQAELEGIAIKIENPEDCRRYSALILDDVKVGDSPEWLQTRLIECGMRPVNNVVDVTNFVMLETGQPLHAFDADKIQGERIEVRRAKPGEKITTLDEVERELSPDVLVIADAQNPIAVAGVMGGQNSEVTTSTKRVLLESANFSASAVRASIRAIGLNSEASRRFTRWVDPNETISTASRAAQLIAETGQAKRVPGVADAYPSPLLAAQVTLRVVRANAVLGAKYNEQNISEIFARLGLEVLSAQDGTLVVSIPTFRRDIEREIDLIEEVARLSGYEKIPTTLPKTVNRSAGRPLSLRLEESARGILLRCGLDEVLTYSLENATDAKRAGLNESTPVVSLRNPLSDDYTQLRTSMIPSLLNALSHNVRSDNERELRLFEIGKVYVPQTGKTPNERRRVCIALYAPPPQQQWQKEVNAQLDFFSLKGIIENFLAGLNAPTPQFRAALYESFHPGRSAALSLAGEDIAMLGEVHPDVAESYDLRHRAYIAVLDFEALVRHIALVPQYHQLSNQPAADRDLALVVPVKISAAAIINVARRAAGSQLEDARIFDVYTGAPIEEGYKSVAIGLRFRNRERTLKEEEIQAAMQSIRDAATKDLGAKFRE